MEQANLNVNEQRQLALLLGSVKETDKELGVFAFIPYNKKWGNNKIYGSVSAFVNKQGKGYIKLKNSFGYISRAVVKAIGAEKFDDNYDFVTFSVRPQEGNNWNVIDQATFQLSNNHTGLSDCQEQTVFIEITTFVAPENQIWIEESYYEEYARDISAIYECSDGTLTRSYAEFKSWEKELSIRPNNPNYDVLPNDVSISDIEHYEVASDGTLWRDASLLQEYLGWRKNPSYNYVNGYYCGVYGVANSFLEYAKIHNASYFILQGLRRAEQFIDPINNFLFVSQSRVDEYVKSIKSFQKII